LRLSLDGGTPWETFQAERAAIRASGQPMPPAYRLYKLFVLALSLLVPSRTFYRLKRRYSASGVRKLRERIAAAGAETSNVDKMQISGPGGSTH
jgi:hypothetical protein